MVRKYPPGHKRPPAWIRKPESVAERKERAMAAAKRRYENKTAATRAVSAIQAKLAKLKAVKLLLDKKLTGQRKHKGSIPDKRCTRCGRRGHTARWHQQRRPTRPKLPPGKHALGPTKQLR